MKPQVALERWQLENERGGELGAAVERAAQLEQLPAQDLDREILVRAEIGDATHAFCADCRDAGARFSVGYELGEAVRQAILELRESAWVPVIDGDGEQRDGAWSPS